MIGAELQRAVVGQPAGHRQRGAVADVKGAGDVRKAGQCAVRAQRRGVLDDGALSGEGQP